MSTPVKNYKLSLRLFDRHKGLSFTAHFEYDRETLAAHPVFAPLLMSLDVATPEMAADNNEQTSVTVEPVDDSHE